MNVSLIIYLGIGVVLLYSIQIAYYAFALKRSVPLQKFNDYESQIKVSLIVPVRNEIESLKHLIPDILAQDYPTDKFEVLFIDDHSVDGSYEVLQKYCSSNLNFNLYKLENNIFGKKQAIRLACNQALGDWIVQTDADCRLKEGFISGHVQSASDTSVALVAGPVLYTKGKGVWNRLESLELLSLTATSMASFLIDKPIMCSGANLSYSKQFYLEIQDELMSVGSPSGDDMFLLIQAKKKNKKLAYLNSKDYLVLTSATGSIKAFINQRLRWGSKSKYYKDNQIIYISLVVWLASFTKSSFLVGSLFSSTVFFFFLPLFLIKTISEFFLLYYAASVFRKRYLLWVFPLAALIYYFYITFTGMLALITKYKWKGRSYTK